MTTHQNLTGTWNGLYSYPQEIASANFVATLTDIAASLTGEVQEAGLDTRRRRVTLTASLAGRRDGGEVVFSKTYDGAGGWSHTVLYDGRLNADGTEIEGRWNIPGIWSGKFMMIRETGVAAEVGEKVAERA